MHRDSETTIIERTPPVRKRGMFSIMPYCAVIIGIAFLGAMVIALGTAGRVRAGGTKSDRSSIPPMLIEAPMAVPKSLVPVRFQHMIFRIGDVEICRFTYEEGDTEDGHEQ